MPQIAVYELKNLVFFGPDPWLPGANGNGSALGNTTFTVTAGTSPVVVDITDNDLYFDDADSSQDLTFSETVNGTSYGSGQQFENEYSYVIRPVGATDPADYIEIHVIDEGGNTPSFGLASTAPLQPGVTYEFVSLDNNPSVLYSDLFVCFGVGTQIATPDGPRPVETLQAGALVETLDDGPQPIQWIGARDLQFNGDASDYKPVLVSKDALGEGVPANDLRLSPQHRVLINPMGEVLVPAKALLEHKGVRVMKGCRAITYYTILLQRHSVIFAEGVPCESLYPTPYALSLLDPAQRLHLRAVLPGLTDDVEASYGPAARPLFKVSEVRGLCQRERLIDLEKVAMRDAI